MIDRLFITRVSRKLLRVFRPTRVPPLPNHSLEELRGPVLVAVAHPDDEVFCSGLICALVQKDVQVSILCFTRGEGGERGPLGEDVDLGSVREAEMKAAASVLGITNVTFLDYIDPAMAGHRLRAPQLERKTFERDLLTHFDVTGAQTIITHGSSGEYWHPAHYCLHETIRRILRGKETALWTFNAWDPDHPLSGILNRDDPPHLTIDGSPHFETRARSLREHTTQRAVFDRFAGGDLEQFIARTATEHYHRVST